MKRIKLISSVLFIFFALSAMAEEVKKPVLGIEKFTYTNAFSKEDVARIRNQIVKAIQKTERVIVVDHNNSTNEALLTEAERRKQESAMDANSVDDMVTLNANSLLTAHLEQLNATQEIYEERATRKNGDKTESYVKARHTYYVGHLSYSIKIIDCTTGSVQFQETFSINVGHYNTIKQKPDFANAQEAENGVLSQAVNQDAISLMILNTFKPSGKIIKIDEGDAKKAKTVYVSLGSENGIQKKQMLEVFQEIDLDGEISKKLIGELEVTEILGGTRCLAKVKKGGDAIARALAAGDNLPVQTRDVKQKFWGGVK